MTGEDIDIPAEGVSEPGELWVSGPNVMVGYLNNDAATADTIDADGFLHTGDMAVVDSNGFVYIVDRLKELIKYKGYQVPPAELEALLLTHPDVVDVAVIGVIEPRAARRSPRRLSSSVEGSDLTGEQVMEFVGSQVAPHKKVRAGRVHRVDPEERGRQDPAQGSAQVDRRQTLYHYEDAPQICGASSCIRSVCGGAGSDLLGRDRDRFGRTVADELVRDAQREHGCEQCRGTADDEDQSERRLGRDRETDTDVDRRAGEHRCQQR